MIKNNAIANELIDGGLGGHNCGEINVEKGFRKRTVKVGIHYQGGRRVGGDYCRLSLRGRGWQSI